MGYYLRLLAPSDDLPDFNQLAMSVIGMPGVSLAIEAGDPDDWTQLLLAHDDETPIAQIERNLVAPDELGEEEIAELLDEIDDAKPASAVAWLQEYLPTVKCIYAFQVLSGTDQAD